MGAKRSSPPFWPSVEPLDGRCLLAAGATASLRGGVLTITGTAHNDRIEVTASGSQLVVAGSLSAKFSLKSVRSVVVNGLAGNDTIRMKDNIPDTISGGDGNDT